MISQLTKQLLHCALLLSLLGCQSLISQEQVFSNQEYTSLLCVRKDGKFGFINERGEEVIPCIYDQPSAFYEGWAALKRGRKWAYFNARGQKVLDLRKRFTHCGDFHDGAALVSTTPTLDTLSIYGAYWKGLCEDLQFINRKGEILFKVANQWNANCALIESIGFADGLLKVT